MIPFATRLPAGCVFGDPKTLAVDPVAPTQYSAEAKPSSDAADTPHPGQSRAPAPQNGWHN
eukprot:1173067-Amphidinium_carterae.1